MSKVKAKLLVTLFLSYVLIGLIYGVILYYVFPIHYFKWYPYIPCFYSILGVILALALHFFEKRHPTKIINVYMMMRGIKFLITALSIVIYDLFISHHKYEFSITTVAFYFLYMFIETLLFYKYEKLRGSK